TMQVRKDGVIVEGRAPEHSPPGAEGARLPALQLLIVVIGVHLAALVDAVALGQQRGRVGAAVAAGAAEDLDGADDAGLLIDARVRRQADRCFADESRHERTPFSLCVSAMGKTPPIRPGWWSCRRPWRSPACRGCHRGLARPVFLSAPPPALPCPGRCTWRTPDHP